MIDHTGRWQWTFYFLAIINFAHFVLYLFFCPETLFDRPERSLKLDSVTATLDETPNAGKWYTPYKTFRIHNKEPWRKLPVDVISPLRYIIRPTILLPSLAYAITFTYTNVSVSWRPVSTRRFKSVL